MHRPKEEEAPVDVGLTTEAILGKVQAMSGYQYESYEQVLYC